MTIPKLNYLIIAGAIFIYLSVIFWVLPAKEELLATVFCNVRAKSNITCKQKCLIYPTAISFFLSSFLFTSIPFSLPSPSSCPAHSSSVYGYFPLATHSVWQLCCQRCGESLAFSVLQLKRKMLDIMQALIDCRVIVTLVYGWFHFLVAPSLPLSPYLSPSLPLSLPSPLTLA